MISTGQADDRVVSAQGMGKAFGDVRAVVDVSLSVRAGQVVGVLGPNGAGKTTTIKLLTTLLALDSGTARVGGFDVRSDPDVVRQVVGVVGQGAAVDEKLTARENLDLFCRLYKMPTRQRRERVAQLVERFDMVDFADRVVSTYSGGQRRRLDVAAALVAEPPALFLDEPTAGLDPRSRAELWRAIRDLARQGAAIVLTTQYLEEADALADHIVLIDGGRIVAEGTPAALKRNLERDVLEVQLGQGRDGPAASAVLGRSGGDVRADQDGRTLAVALDGGPEQALRLLRDLQDGGIAVSDFQLRRPTLDDVFLELTGPAPVGEVPAS